MHHSMMLSITTKHASAGGVMRMASRWVAGHMLSGQIPQEAIELLVAKVYTDRGSSLEPPGSVAAGFLRFLQLVASHDWVRYVLCFSFVSCVSTSSVNACEIMACSLIDWSFLLHFREPLIVDPHGHIDDDDRNAIRVRFEQVRGHSQEGGPPMYIISPNDRRGGRDTNDSSNGTAQENSNGNPSAKTGSDRNHSMMWDPSFTAVLPEAVGLFRMKALAKKSRAFLLSKLTSFDSTTAASAAWLSAFQETETSFRAYSALLRVDSDFVVDEHSSSTGIAHDSEPSPDTSYTRSMRDRFLGPKALRLKHYRNMLDTGSEHQILQDWRPIDHLVESLRNNFGSFALFFYNHLSPNVIAVLWRPHVSETKSFAVVSSEFVQPCVTRQWKNDTMVMVNANDIFREMSQYFCDMVTNVKLFQAPTPKEISPPSPSLSSSSSKRKKSAIKDDESSDSESESD